MTIRVALDHLTRYCYDRPVRLGPQVVRLRPAPHCRTPISGYGLQVTPQQHFINWQQDPFGNYLARLVFPEPTREFALQVGLIADMTVINPFNFFLEDDFIEFPFRYTTTVAAELAPYLQIRENGPLLLDWLAQIDRRKRRVNDFLVELNQRLSNDIFYNVRMQPGVQSCEQTLQKASGSCRDSAWLLTQVLRHLGLASRFVSGYLVQLRADEKSLDGPSGPEQDFTDLHAWSEVYLPGAGWVGLDPTSGLFAAEGHIPLACSADPGSAAPVSGVVHDAAEVEFYFHNKVSRVHQDPRVTRPYSDGDWQLIDALGHKVDADLNKEDVRLTQGGEPTFVSIDEREDPQWHTGALGVQKRERAGELLRRLQARYAPGGLLHYGQGKWYPGEATPRWALSCFWRHDGEPLWRDATLLAEPPADPKVRQADSDPEPAQRFAQALAARLGISDIGLCAGYEDPLYYLWQESQLAPGQDSLAVPADAKLDDPEARANLAKVLSRGLAQPVGYVLPLAFRYGPDPDRPTAGGGWLSGRWPLRRDQLYLIPGDSPMGLRLPLQSLPPLDPLEQDFPQDPFAPRTELDPASDATNIDASPHPEPIHTMLCVEQRAGTLTVFLPPLTRLEAWLALLHQIEAVAAELQTAVVLEGYPPPDDPRLRRFSVTPDPGVIEVNVHPVGSWDELLVNTEALYEEARKTRLGAEKFSLDGRHTGTGGGNHITLGGPTPADSPILRRPDLLRSLITYWQHHPALSYLFSGQFIGPTSQAPRIDEARFEALYELEIAFSQLPDGDVKQPWLVDRLLRHLLTDLSGNTHRAEFCIDKLYSPDGPAGRLGLLELRAFEMPPHARMSLVQSLLVRALVAKFWRRPYRAELVRWGTELHDRFMLPHYLRRDMAEVCADLATAGYPFQPSWLEPFFEFRFPRCGSVQIDDMELELRLAIEPWHVLGEEPAGGATARFVDSSVERLQVKVSGITDGRHIITCNDRRVPLRATGRLDEQVAGVRFRAWQPPTALHPTIPPQVPLRFDLVDTWNNRSIGGCTYHIEHPGGNNSDDLPVNANAAEARRAARFFDFGRSPEPLRPPPALAALAQFTTHDGAPGPFHPAEPEPDAEYPHTLDLRR